MSSSISAIACSCWILVIASGSLVGQEAPAKGEKSAPPRVTAAEVKSLITQLGGAKEVDRQAAIKKLQAAGLAAIPAVADAAAKGNTHATNNAIEILTVHVKGTDAEARQAAFEELRRLSVGDRPAVASVAKKIVKEHPDLKAVSDAARLAAREKRAANAEVKPAQPTETPRPKPAAPVDTITGLRRQAIEQQLKDGESAIDKIKKLKLPKDQESQQISAIMLGLQKLRADLKKLDNAGQKK